jgi:hypothetical protein
MAILITIEGTATHGALIRDALCSMYGYQETIDGVANPETKTAFSKRMIRDFIKENIIAYRVKEAEAARIEKIASAEAESTGIQAN